MLGLVYNLGVGRPKSMPPDLSQQAAHLCSFGAFFSGSVNFRFVSPLIHFDLHSLQPRGRFFDSFDVQFTHSTISLRAGFVIMYSKLSAIAALVALVEARFGQEGLVQNKISALSNFGNPGQAATLAGASPGVLLAGANACAKVNLLELV